FCHSSIALAMGSGSCNKSRSILRRVYFSNLWRGTATLVAAFLLLLSLIQAVTSIIDVIKLE
ncbi:hypothetical protein, partial [Klebsiella aerogenes]|uniref:hypothetical protein n=1 Tax=Klebsiella aerogenes TaxID=548 RepID=UPI0019544A9D